MITNKRLESQIETLKSSTGGTSAGLQLRHFWADMARTAVDMAGRATTPQQFEEAERVLSKVNEAMAVARTKLG